MVRIIIALLFCFPAVTFAQTYQQLSERAIECIEKDSLPQAEELLIQALKLEPKNAKNALLFSNLGLVQRRLGEFDKALESYSFALNFAPLAVPILLDRAAIYMEMGKTDRAYTDYCQVLDVYWSLIRRAIAGGWDWLLWSRKKENSGKLLKY